MQEWLTRMVFTSSQFQSLSAHVGPKSPGLVVLEHEDSDDALQAFVDAFPKILENGWKFESLARLFGQGRAYQNAVDNVSEVKPYDVMAGPSNGSTVMVQSSMVTSSAPLPST